MSRYAAMQSALAGFFRQLGRRTADFEHGVDPLSFLEASRQAEREKRYPDAYGALVCGLAVARCQRNRRAEGRLLLALGHNSYVYRPPLETNEWDLRTRRAKEALRVSRRARDAETEAGSLRLLAYVSPLREKIRLHRASLAICERTGDARGRAESLCKLANASKIIGERDAALKLADEGIAAWRQTGDRAELAHSLLSHAVQFDASTMRRRAMIEEARAIFDELHLAKGVLRSLQMELTFARPDNEFGRERWLLEQSVAIARGMGQPKETAICLRDLAYFARGHAEVERAEALFTEANQLDPPQPETPEDIAFCKSIETLMDRFAAGDAESAVNDLSQQFQGR